MLNGAKYLSFDSRLVDGDIEAEDEALRSFMHGRRGRERSDSITLSILRDRQVHRERMMVLARSWDPPEHVVVTVDRLKLGSKRRLTGAYTKTLTPADGGPTERRTTTTGACGHAVHLTSASENWPIFKHVLPEVALAGHSNSGPYMIQLYTLFHKLALLAILVTPTHPNSVSHFSPVLLTPGKSTLVNALVGVAPNKGPAGVSDRAGWTDQLCFFQLGKRPPILTLVDLPGYGHAVASREQRLRWTKMTTSYLTTRPVLSRCHVLVDSTRGLCGGDLRLLRLLRRHKVPFRVVLTKTDLLTPSDLVAAIGVVASDLDRLSLVKSFARRIRRSLVQPDDDVDDELEEGDWEDGKDGGVGSMSQYNRDDPELPSVLDLFCKPGGELAALSAATGAGNVF